MALVRTCPVCDRQYTLTENGKLPNHLERSVAGRKISPPCEGTGRAPVPDPIEK